MGGVELKRAILEEGRFVVEDDLPNLGGGHGSGRGERSAKPQKLLLSLPIRVGGGEGGQ